jgi:hypothetical protein
MSKTTSDPKPVQLSAEALNTIRTALSAPSVCDRVKRAMEALAVVTVAMTPQNDDKHAPGPCLEFEATDAEAIRGLLGRAYDELYWLTQLPTSVINADAPTDDQRHALDAMGGVR